MNDLKLKFKNVRTDKEAIQILKEEFEKRDYPKTRTGASNFQNDLKKEIPGINKWVIGWTHTGSEIEDVIMDIFNIP